MRAHPSDPMQDYLSEDPISEYCPIQVLGLELQIVEGGGAQFSP